MPNFNKFKAMKAASKSRRTSSSMKAGRNKVKKDIQAVGSRLTRGLNRFFNKK
tara:strand:- start:57 stop:215 length:159 start_codon:yes stop_codon:yes gene_type:complete